MGTFLSGGSGRKADPSAGMVIGDSIQLFNASNLEEIVPRKTVPENARTSVLQHNDMQPVMGALGQFFKKNTPSDVGVDIPALVDGNLGKISDKDARILIIGSPLMHDNSARDLRQGWPSDGFFDRDALVSVFSTKNKGSLLRGLSVRFCIPETPWATGFENSHKEGIRRFWALYVNKCGGHLVSFQEDVNEGFHDLLNNDLTDLVQEFHFTVNPEDSGMEIRKTSFSRNTAPVAPPISIEQSWLQIPAEDWNKAKSAPSIEKLPSKGGLQIGLCWDTTGERSDSDLDLHVGKKGEKGELFFKNQETIFGKSSKDLFADERANHGFELVKITKPCSPSDLEVWVNVYAGHSSSGFTGQVRVLYAGRLMVYPFTIPSTEGNNGGENPKRSKNSHWIHIDLSRPN